MIYILFHYVLLTLCTDFYSLTFPFLVIPWNIFQDLNPPENNSVTLFPFVIICIKYLVTKSQY